MNPLGERHSVQYHSAFGTGPDAICLRGPRTRQRKRRSDTDSEERGIARACSRPATVAGPAS